MQSKSNGNGHGDGFRDGVGAERSRSSPNRSEALSRSKAGDDLDSDKLLFSSLFTTLTGEKMGSVVCADSRTCWAHGPSWSCLSSGHSWVLTGPRPGPRASNSIGIVRPTEGDLSPFIYTAQQISTVDNFTHKLNATSVSIARSR